MTQMDRLRTLARDRGMTVLPDGSGFFKATVGRDAIETRDPGVEKTMHEFKRGALHSGSKRGPKVTSRKQAIAIALSKQRRGDAATPHDPRSGQFASTHKAMGQYHMKQSGTAHRAAATAHYEAASAHRSGSPQAGRLSNVARSASVRAGVNPKSMPSRLRTDSRDAATQWDRIRRKANDRGLMVGDEVKHDPRSGQFTSAGQHTAASEQHHEEAANHETASHGSRGESRLLHRQAMRAHARASSAHETAARGFGSPGYHRAAETAHTATQIAMHRSRQAGGA